MERQGEGSSLLSDPIPGEKENHRDNLENLLQMSNATLHCGALVRTTEDKAQLPKSTQWDLCT